MPFLSSCGLHQCCKTPRRPEETVWEHGPKLRTVRFEQEERWCLCGVECQCCAFGSQSEGQRHGFKSFRPHSASLHLEACHMHSAGMFSLWERFLETRASVCLLTWTSLLSVEASERSLAASLGWERLPARAWLALYELLLLLTCSVWLQSLSLLISVAVVSYLLF